MANYDFLLIIPEIYAYPLKGGISCGRRTFNSRRTFEAIVIWFGPFYRYTFVSPMPCAVALFSV